MTKVTESSPFESDGHSFTTLFLDERPPRTMWRKVRVGGEEYDPVFMSGPPARAVSIPGVHRLDGKAVEFV